MTKPYMNLYDLDRKMAYFPEELIQLRPKLHKSPYGCSRCQVAIVVTPDLKRSRAHRAERLRRRTLPPLEYSPPVMLCREICRSDIRNGVAVMAEHFMSRVGGLYATSKRQL